MLFCSLTMPTGTPVDRTTEVVSQIESAAKEALESEDEKRPPGSESLFRAQRVDHRASIWPVTGRAQEDRRSADHLAQVYVQLLEGEKTGRQRNKADQRLASKRSAPSKTPSPSRFKATCFRAGNPIEVHLSMDNEDMLLTAADELKEELGTFPGVFDIADSFLPGKKEMQLKLKHTARSLGLTLNDLARQVRHAFYGAEALRLQRDQDEVKVLVRFPDEERKSLGDVDRMRIRSSTYEVPFRQVAEVNMKQGYTTIQRAQRRRVIKVYADVDEGGHQCQ